MSEKVGHELSLFLTRKTARRPKLEESFISGAVYCLLLSHLLRLFCI